MKRTAFVLAAAALLAASAPGSASPGATAETDPARCSPTPPVAAVLAEADRLGDACPGGGSCWSEREKLIAEALAEHPGDLHAHRAYQDLFRFPYPEAEARRDEIYARYRELAESADDAVALYLAGRLEEDKEAQYRLCERAVAADPGLGWAHLALASASFSRESASVADVERHYERFLELCPDEIATALPYATRVSDEARIAELAATLRRQLEAGLDGDRYDDFQALWRLEFRLTPPAEYDRLRTRVAADLERIAALGREGDFGWWRTLRQGAELAGDAERVAAVDRAVAERSPCSQNGAHATVESWRAENPPPAPGAPAAERDAHSRRLYEAAGGWLERCPWSLRLALERFGALRDGVAESLDDEALRAEVEAFVGRWRDRRDAGVMIPSPLLGAAEMLAERAVAPELVIELARNGLEGSRGHFEERLARPELSDEQRHDAETSLAWVIGQARRAEARGQIAAGRTEEAAALVLEVAATVDRLVPGAEASDAERFGHRRASAELKLLEAEVAAAEERSADAAAYLLAARRALPENDIATRGFALWQRLGGTEAGWQALDEELTAAGGDARVARWETLDEPLEFELIDLEGKTWKHTDLAGKTVFVNQWATWCGPCRLELPLIEELHRRLGERDDVVVLTFNLDQNPGLIGPYLDRHEMTFPVLLAQSWERLQGGTGGIPCNWVIDAEGTLRREQRGFRVDQDTDEWLAEATAILDEVATGGL